MVARLVRIVLGSLGLALYTWFAAVRQPPAGARPQGGTPGEAPEVRSLPMKGVILAGGSGTRLHPLTRITNKHLLPLYDRPMVTYAVEALVRPGSTS